MGRRCLQFAFSSHCCSVISWKKIKLNFLPGQVALNMYRYQKLVFPKCWTLHFSLNCMTFLSAQLVLLLVEVSLDGSTALPVLCHLQKLKVEPCYKIQSINETTEQTGPSIDVGYSTSYWHPIRLCTADHYPLSMAAKPVFNPRHCAPLKPIVHYLVYEDTMGQCQRPYGSLVKRTSKRIRECHHHI